MDKADTIHEIQEILKQLRGDMSILDQKVMLISEKISEGMFLPLELTKGVRSIVESIELLNRQCAEKYQHLESEEEIPEYISDLEKALETLEKRIKSKEVFCRTISDFMNLRCDDAETDRYLKKHQEYLAKLDIAQMNEQECKEKLEDYILFMETYYEEDAAKWIEYIHRLYGQFENKLITAITYAPSVYMLETPDAIACADSSEQEPNEFEPVITEDIKEEMEPLYEKLSLPDNYTESSLQCEKSQRETKKFGVKEFKSDLKSRFGVLKKRILVITNKYNSITVGLINEFRGVESENIRLAFGDLCQRGYLRKYSVEGLGECYCLSSRGLKAFDTRDSCSLLEVPYRKGREQDEPLEEGIATAISRIVYAKIFEQGAPRCKNGGFPSLPKIGNGSFIFEIFPDKDGENIHLFTGIYTSQYEKCEAYYQELMDKIESNRLKKLVVEGVNKDHGEAQAEVLSAKCAGAETALCSLYYHDFASDRYYEYPGNRTVTPDFIWADIEGDQKEAESDDEEESPENDESETVAVEPELSQKDSHNDKIFVNKDSRQQITEDFQQMILADKIYCATTYLRAAAKEFEPFKLIYEAVAYAVNDPVENCRYNADHIMNLYFNESYTLTDHYMLAAALRTYFFDHVEYEYNLDGLYNNVKRHKIISEDAGLGNLLYELLVFKEKTGKGIDAYADYRSQENAQWEYDVKKVCQDAKQYYDTYVLGPIVENKSHKRFLETRKLIFSIDNELSECLKLVADDERNMTEFINDYLKTYFIKESSSVDFVNVDSDKVYMFMDEHWQRAGKAMRIGRKTSDLMSHLRNNLYSAITKVVKILCDWVLLIENCSISDNDFGVSYYKNVKDSILDYIDTSYKYMEDRKAVLELAEAAGLQVLQFTLKELRNRLTGSYSDVDSRFFYIGFLKNRYVFLDEDYYPDIESKIFFLDDFPLLERIRRHFQEEEIPFEEHLHIIFTEGGDDYGSARIIDEYCKAAAGESVIEQNYKMAEYVEWARKKAVTRKKECIENLELAQSYGQIDNSAEDKKEKTLRIVNEWFDYANETENFGFFFRGLDSLEEKIRKDAMDRGKMFEQELSVYKQKNQEWQQDEALVARIEKVQSMLDLQNYTVAEDLIRRLNSDEPEAGFDWLGEDYLVKFFEEYDYHYRRAADSGKALSSVKMMSSRTNKDTRGGKRLLENWLKNNGYIGETRMADLLETLGFDVRSVTEQEKIGKIENYTVLLKRPVNGRKINFKHTIAPFGSRAAEEGFRVICLYGRFDAERLVDVFKELGNAKNTLVMLDYALTISERRYMARLVKAQVPDRIFAVLDRVMLMFLSNNYMETAINRMLMTILMPFAYYQPYVVESANVMPPEIFMGRKEELEKIESSEGVNIVYGGRQLGKSALLRMAQNDIDRNENNDRAVLVDIKGLDYNAAAIKVGHALFDEDILQEDIQEADWEELSRRIKRRLQNQNQERIPYLLLMLDEADTFIESCVEVNYSPFDALKDIQSIGSGRFKFVVAGLRNIVRFKRKLALGNNSVLTHLQSMTVTPFKVAEARKLLEIPLYYLGFRFPAEKDFLISMILASTNYFPGLIQLYCAKLVEAMKKGDYAGYNEVNSPPYIIEESHIKKVLTDSGFRRQIYEKFEITLRLDEDNYYYIIALILAHLYHTKGSKEGYTPEEIYQIGCEFEMEQISRLSMDELVAFIEEMCELNVFRKTTENRYLYTRYSFFQMMGSAQEVDDEMLKYMEE